MNLCKMNACACLTKQNLIKLTFWHFNEYYVTVK